MKPALARLSSIRFLKATFVCGIVVLLSGCLTQSRLVQFENKPSPTGAAGSTVKLININTASINDLETLPGIGPGMASRIVEHRERYGRFRRAEHLIMVRGLSHKRFRAMRSAVVVE